jgi:hypothetical protein
MRAQFLVLAAAITVMWAGGVDPTPAGALHSDHVNLVRRPSGRSTAITSHCGRRQEVA